MRALPARDAAPLAEARPVLLAAGACASRRIAAATGSSSDEAAAIEAQRQRQRAASCRARSACAALQRSRRGRSRRRARRRAHARGRARARRRGGPPRRRARRHRRRRKPARRAPSRRGRRAGRGRAVPVLADRSGGSSRPRPARSAGPKACASVTMPSPQTRAIFGMSAVSTTISPSASARSISRSRRDAALLAHVAAAGAGAADGAHAEMPKRDRVELAVAGARHEARGAVLRALGEMDHEVLAMPHGGDDRHHRPDAIIGVCRLHDQAVRAPDEAEIARRPEPQHLADRARAAQALEPFPSRGPVKPAADRAADAGGR